MRKLSALLGCEGGLQVDACPFHSRRLPNKLALLRTIQEGGLLGTYVGHVSGFLRHRPAVNVAAISSQESLRPALQLNARLEWKAGLAGLDLSRAEFVPILERNGKVTAAALIGRAGCSPEALVLMMGGNHLPAGRRLANSRWPYFRAPSDRLVPPLPCRLSSDHGLLENVADRSG